MEFATYLGSKFAAVRRAGRADRSRDRDHAGSMGTGRRRQDRDLYQDTVQFFPLSAYGFPDCQSSAMGEDGAQLGWVQQGSNWYGAVSDYQGSAWTIRGTLA